MKNIPVTDTEEGPIPALKYGNLWLVVKVLIEKNNQGKRKPTPIRVDGKLVYAVPGGGEYRP